MITKTRLNLSLTPEAIAMLKSIALSRGLTLTSAVETLIREEVKNKPKK